MQTFTSLRDAVQFLAGVIEEEDHDALASACHEPLPPDWVLQRLHELHESTPLPQLYAEWEFPSDSEEFKLGGHASELGHVHVDFLRTESGFWELQRVWMCR